MFEDALATAFSRDSWREKAQITLIFRNGRKGTSTRDHTGNNKLDTTMKGKWPERTNLPECMYVQKGITCSKEELDLKKKKENNEFILALSLDFLPLPFCSSLISVLPSPSFFLILLQLFHSSPFERTALTLRGAYANSFFLPSELENSCFI